MSLSPNWRNCFQISLSLLIWTFLPLLNHCNKSEGLKPPQLFSNTKKTVAMWLDQYFDDAKYQIHLSKIQKNLINICPFSSQIAEAHYCNGILVITSLLLFPQRDTEVSIIDPFFYSDQKNIKIFSVDIIQYGQNTQGKQYGQSEV